MNFAVVLGLLCMVAYTSADGHTCHCSSYFSGHVDDAHAIHRAPDVEMTSCDDTQKTACHDQCQTIFNRLTDHGNLGHITSKGTTLAEFSCDKFGGDIADGQLACYSKLCDGAWEHIEDTKGKTCCHGGHSIECAHH